jgi:hypothetical protein
MEAQSWFSATARQAAQYRPAELAGFVLQPERRFACWYRYGVETTCIQEGQFQLESRWQKWAKYGNMVLIFT